MSFFKKLFKGGGKILGGIISAAGGILKHVPLVGPIAGGLVQGAGSLISKLSVGSGGGGGQAQLPAAVTPVQAATYQTNLKAGDIIDVGTSKDFFKKYWWIFALVAGVPIMFFLVLSLTKRKR